MVALGSLGTALAFFWFTALIGRVGPTRAAVAIYFVPVVAIASARPLNDERMHAAALLGTALVLAGAYLTSRPSAALGGRARRELLPELAERAQLVAGEVAQEALAHAVQVGLARALEQRRPLS